MLKELIVTSLLSFSVGSLPLKHVNNLSNNGVYSLKGGYCLRDVVGNDMGDGFYDRVGDDTYIIYDSTDYADGMPDIYAFWYHTNDYITIREFSIYVAMDEIDTYGLFNFSISLGEEEIYQNNVSTGDHLGEFDITTRNCIVYFPVSYYVDMDTYHAFTSLFTGVGNDYISLYSGYYSFVNASYHVNYELMGNVMNNNSLYNMVTYTGLENGYNAPVNCSCSLVDYDDFYGGTLYSDVITNGKFSGDKRLLFDNVLIPNYIKTYMQNSGVFAYQYDSVDFDFGDMVFSVMDAPVYMLSQLFSFELFGIQFYVAFMGIVTIVLICFVLKKII